MRALLDIITKPRAPWAQERETATAGRLAPVGEPRASHRAIARDSGGWRPRLALRATVLALLAVSVAPTSALAT
jgi:hypothetical protein